MDLGEGVSGPKAKNSRARPRKFVFEALGFKSEEPLGCPGNFRGADDQPGRVFENSLCKKTSCAFFVP